KVRMGYNNPNHFEQQYVVGQANKFSPGAIDRGQPTRFFAGLNRSAFEVTLASEKEDLTWSINGSTGAINSALVACAGACTDTPTGTINGNLNQVALDLSETMNRAAELLASARAGLSRAQIERNRNDAERSKVKAEQYQVEANSLVIQFPAVTKTCPEAPAFCVTVDRFGVIEALKGLYARQRNSVKRTVARAYWRNTSRTNRRDALVRQAKALEQQGLAELAKLPRFAVECK
ncbi:MAG: hypothetical protein ACK5Y6_00525, partial [Pseudomonadota bacterium]